MVIQISAAGAEKIKILGQWRGWSNDSTGGNEYSTASEVYLLP
jgi:hypothetical protein